MAELLYPVVKKAKTSCGRPIPEDQRFLNLYYCPVCNKRLSRTKVDNNDSLVRLYNKKLKPIFCEKCGSIINPLPKTE